MAIVGLDGRPVTHADGPTGRKITIHEAKVKGRPSWGVEFDGPFDMLEIFQVLADVITGIARQQRSQMVEKKVAVEVQAKMQQMNKEIDSDR